MLDTIRAAMHIKGRRNAAIARELDRTPHTVNQWFGGRAYIPHRIRTALEAAIGAPVDWPAYEAEYQEAKARTPAPALADPAPAPAPRPAPAPQMPAKAPNRPATAPRRITATPPAQKPPARPAVPAMAATGFLSRLFKDDGDLFV